MNVLLIKNGTVENCISADSVERAQTFYPDHLCVKQVGAESTGYTYANGIFTEPVFVQAAIARRITNLAFISRFSDAEAIAIDLASIGATVQAASMRRYLNKTNAATYIDLDRADTRAGVLALESAGILASGRALVILDTEPTEEERYKGQA